MREELPKRFGSSFYAFSALSMLSVLYFRIAYKSRKEGREESQKTRKAE
ncbi:hypothetical protein GCWU000341_01051 [Oribacterium sp. oral taxon 078 str. F0262]|nr:hypothetical protein GCWU000341_01051 [Oribacterium sp. oral taxon 078 str. F0262]